MLVRAWVRIIVGYEQLNLKMAKRVYVCMRARI